MSDDADKTQDRIEIEDEIRKRYRKTYDYVKESGHCLNCGEVVPSGRRWCDKDCAEDWEYNQQRK